MKRSVCIAAAALCAALLLSGCHRTNCAATASSVAEPVSAPGAAASQEVSSETPSSQAVSSGTSASEAVQPGSVSSQGGIVKTISTDSKKFNEKFKKNPIDASYAKAIQKAFSNTSMEEVFDKYVGVWQKEIDHAYSTLKKDLASDPAKWKQAEDGQKAWKNGKDAALKKIADDAAEAGGSYAQVQASSDTMEYYRERAAALYRMLYDCDKNYAYAFSG